MIGDEIDDEGGPRVALSQEEIQFQEDYADQDSESDAMDSSADDSLSEREIDNANDAVFPRGGEYRPQRQARRGKMICAIASLLEPDSDNSSMIDDEPVDDAFDGDIEDLND